MDSTNGRTHSPSPRQSPAYRLTGLQSVNTTLSSGFSITPASARGPPSAVHSPYLHSIPSSPGGAQAQESPNPSNSPGPFELPEPIIGSDFSDRPASFRDSASTVSNKGAGGIIRKLSVTAKASVQSTGQMLRRKASSSNQRRDQSTGPITRRRSDSKTMSSTATSVADTDFDDAGSNLFTDSFSSLGVYDVPTSIPNYDLTVTIPSTFNNPEGTAPTVPEGLIRGSILTRVTKGKRKQQSFFLNVEGSRVSWSGKLGSKQFWIDDIRGIRTGDESFVHRQELKCLDVDPSCWLTVLYADPDRSRTTKTLSVFANLKETVKLWIDTLEALSKHRQDLMTGMTGSGERESVIRAHWDSEIAKSKSTSAGHSDGEGLQLSAIEVLCRKLHIHCSKAMIKEHFALADISKNGSLDYEEFKDFVRRLKARQDLRPIFKSLKGDNEHGISKSQFLTFLETTQGLDLSKTRLDWCGVFDRYVERPARGQSHQASEEDGSFPCMDFEAFSSFIVSDRCDIYQPLSKEPKFDRPLTEYFISSSHNTYLKGRQVAGESSTEPYITALRHGCRCVELDCWNGPDGRPRVTHGRTRTTAVLFSDCITVIGRYAFENSPYPVILSLEVHCDVEQQSRMVAIMKEILGEKLLTQPFDEESSLIPSPEDLKHKILIKVKSTSSSLDNGHSAEVVVSNRQRSISSPRRQAVVPVSSSIPSFQPLPSPATISPPTSHSDTLYSPNERSMTTTSASSAGEESDSQQALSATMSNSPVKAPRLTNITQQLADLGVYLQGYKYRGFKTTEAQKVNHIFSLDESKAGSLCQTPEEKAEFEDHNVHHFCRVYPKGLRVDSSNFDPNTFWRRGVQMVALNWQTYDPYMQMNQAMFAAGADQFGYVLKPDYMRQPRVRNGDITRRLKLPRQSVKFSVEIVSAQQLPRLHDMHRSGCINPFVEVQMFSAEDKSRGIASGTGGEESSARGGYSGIGSPYSRRTKVVVDNGYSPQFNDVFDLSLETKYPELVFVRFIVWNSPDGRYVGNKCKQLAVFTTKLSSLEQGYRHLPLYNGSGEEFIFSTLFCKIKKSEPRLIATSLQEISDRSSGRGLIRNMLTRNISADRAREQANSLEKQPDS